MKTLAVVLSLTCLCLATGCEDDPDDNAYMQSDAGDGDSGDGDGDGDSGDGDGDGDSGDGDGDADAGADAGI